MPRAWVWTLFLPLVLIRPAAGEIGWDRGARSTSRAEQTDDEAIIQDLDVLGELEMLQMLEILQELEMLNEMDSPLLPESPREGTAR